MSILAIASPVEATLPFVRVAASVARPLLGLGAIITVLMLFKPLIVGLFRAGWIAIVPHRSLEERENRRTLRGVLMLNRMARDLDLTQPNLASELRLLAARG